MSLYFNVKNIFIIEYFMYLLFIIFIICIIYLYFFCEIYFVLIYLFDLPAKTGKINYGNNHSDCCRDHLNIENREWMLHLINANACIFSLFIFTLE